MGMRLLDIARFIVAIACGMALTPAAWTLENPALDGIVTKVIDGDTLRVQLDSGPVTVRLGEIDAPESVQPGGGAATRALDSRVLGERVSLRVISRDGEERVVAVVYLGDENVNAWMVKQGHAWAYRGHTREADYCVWENAARSLRRGLWAEKHWVAPWDWRMSRHDSLFFASDYSNASAAGCIREISQSIGFDE
jgi:endonuclease YncB( thermonuclease family)